VVFQSASRSASLSLGPSTISAPQNNLPASSAILFSDPLLPTDEIETGKREIVRLLLPFQDPTGKFVAVNESSTITNVLGADLERFVDTFISNGGPLHNLPMLEVKSMATLCDIARTASVLQILRIHFQGSMDLWQLMDAKALDYLRASYAAVTLTRIMDYAKTNVARAHFRTPPDLFGNGVRDWASWGRTLRIPMDSAIPTDPSALGPERPSLDAQTTKSVAGTPEASLTASGSPHIDPAFAFLSQSWSFKQPASLMNIESSGAGQDVEKAAKDGNTSLAASGALPQPDGKQGGSAVAGGEKEASTGHTALHTEDLTPKTLGLPVMYPTGTKVAEKVEEEDLIRRLAVEREVRDGSGGGREVELPDEI
jgi:hypothetical protein